MRENDLLARAIETIAGYLALGNERFEAAGATFIRNRATPRREDTNTILQVRAVSEPDFEALMQRLDAEYAGMNHRRIEVDALTSPEFLAWLTLRGDFRRDEILIQVLEGDLDLAPPWDDIEVREVVSEDDWGAYHRLDALWWKESSVGYFGPYDADLHAELARSFRAKTPAGLRSWMVWADGGGRAYLSSWPGANGVGMVEDLYTEPDYRHRGYASALLRRAVADARERGAGPVIIGADPFGTPKHMYAAAGFRPLFLNQAFTKKPVT